MKSKLTCLIFFILFNFASLFSSEVINELTIHKNLRCLVCQGQSISDSNSEFALTLKSVVKDLIDEGKTEGEIYNFLSDKYGDWILYKPKFNLENIILWVFPYIVLIIGGFIIIFLIKKRSKDV
tara:strand:+ start:124 stop:495 length:372 start_codon:yes stop_codon:yes gene_type:complete